jgi:hypothetical protein
METKSIEQLNQLVNLLSSDNINNQRLCYQLCKGQGIDFREVFNKVFHNKELWKNFYYQKTHIKIFNIYIIFGTVGVYTSQYFVTPGGNIPDNYTIVSYIGSEYAFHEICAAYNTQNYTEETLIEYLYNEIIKHA